MKQELYDDMLIDEMQFITAADGKKDLNELSFEELDAIAAGGWDWVWKKIPKNIVQPVKK